MAIKNYTSFVHLTLRSKFKYSSIKSFVTVILTQITGTQNNLHSIIVLQVANMNVPNGMGALTDAI